MTKTINTASTASAEQTPAVEPRTITYPLKTGGSLTVTCPAWCSYDHSDDVARGIDPDNLFHQGDKIALEYSADGVDLSILGARIGQWPFDPEDGAPYIELIPEGGTAVGVYCTNPLELGEEIRKVRGHLRALEELADQLVAAKVDDHARNTRGDLTPWSSLSRTDLLSLPIAYLLKVFGVRVVESDKPMGNAGVVLGGKPGDMVLVVRPDLPQHVREDDARTALLADFDARFGGRRD